MRSRACCHQTNGDEGEEGLFFWIHKYPELLFHVRSLATECKDPGGLLVPFNFSVKLPRKNRKNDQEILRWWKLENERRQEKPWRPHSYYERSQGGPQCRYVYFDSRFTQFLIRNFSPFPFLKSQIRRLSPYHFLNSYLIKFSSSTRATQFDELATSLASQTTASPIFYPFHKVVLYYFWF